MKIDVMVHCGNAPKMQRVIDLTLALANRNFSEVNPHVRNDFVWSMIGAENNISYDQLSQMLAKQPPVKEIKIENALSHGNGAMCEGVMTLEDGATFSFCTVVRFASTAKEALIKSAHTYLVKK